MRIHMHNVRVVETDCRRLESGAISASATVSEFGDYGIANLFFREPADAETLAENLHQLAAHFRHLEALQQKQQHSQSEDPNDHHRT